MLARGERKLRTIRFAAAIGVVAATAGGCGSAAMTGPVPFSEVPPAQPAGEVRLPSSAHSAAASEPLRLVEQRDLYNAMRQDICDGALERAQRRFRNAEPQLFRHPGVAAGELYDDLVLLSKYVDAMLARAPAH